MQVGTLVRHIEQDLIGVAVQQGVSTCDKWLVVWHDWTYSSFWCSECELEVLCK